MSSNRNENYSTNIWMVSPKKILPCWRRTVEENKVDRQDNKRWRADKNYIYIYENVCSE